MNEPDYIVIRPAPDLPEGFLPERENGRWYDRADMPQAGVESSVDALIRYGGGVAVATDRFEVRDYDGAVAEVYEVRP
ncbi:hypothetical protein ACH4NO_18030 [Streptomyces olivaceus]|uniref:hypothetical protein n=1 Tax=Streptomyces olivaceus TaxID=47716 RepID=UPI0004CAC287|nr:hypothetical protein [Streptomyces olivaceus]MBZ6102709.1 hypothetical protein [Streptomyces olivaceus]